MAEHTRLPWAVASSDTAMVVHRFEPNDPAYGGIIVHTAPKKGTLLVSRGEAEANAALIVKAVNAHDDLVFALREAETAIVGLFKSIAPHANTETSNRFADSDIALALIRAALAKAEG